MNIRHMSVINERNFDRLQARVPGSLLMWLECASLVGVSVCLLLVVTTTLASRKTLEKGLDAVCAL
jgi:hypothetical protein